MLSDCVTHYPSVAENPAYFEISTLLFFHGNRMFSQEYGYQEGRLNVPISLTIRYGHIIKLCTMNVSRSIT